ncbi:MAG: putative toxin-antitoxin system toxin component, PIN family [Clostridiales Family XIII bacterium]|jgi:putative PIN family toxin of toxin-antitoxin system|nr:putative toxin-antitoxin system toxin component, PIN family [Clostridiales Family XIII bacterium]
MRCLIDTNVLISASRNREGSPYRAFLKAVTIPHQGVVCDQNLDELRRVYNRKFPDKLDLLQAFLAFALPVLEVVNTPALDLEVEMKIRDISDRSILRAAIAANVDVIITGDKDFLESGVSDPRIMTAAEFVQEKKSI